LSERIVGGGAVENGNGSSTPTTDELNEQGSRVWTDALKPAMEEAWKKARR
jgi:hypothetical protein